MWLFITLLALIIQLFRNLISKKLSKNLSASTVSLCRFMYGVPIAVLIYWIAQSYYGEVRIISNHFYWWALIFASSQLFANILMVMLFSYKNFAVAITFVRTEAVFTAILALFYLNEVLSLVEWLGIFITFFGIIVIALSRHKIGFATLLNTLMQKTTYLGLLAGCLFGMAVISAKSSFSYLESDVLFVKIIFSLIIFMSIQVFLVLPIVLYKNYKEFIKILRHPKLPIIVSLCSTTASVCWFIAFSLTYVAYVKVIGQAEFILSIFISVYYFKEKIYHNEIIGILLILLGTFLLFF